MCTIFKSMICDEPIFKFHATVVTKQSTNEYIQNRISERDYQQRSGGKKNGCSTCFSIEQQMNALTTAYIYISMSICTLSYMLAGN